MTPAQVRSRLLAVATAALCVAAWVYLAPTQIGGSTQYVITGGISMEPRFHTGDLAVVRPAGEYRVGDIVAYHSTLLHVVVLHRIIGRAGDHYIFKGDNNHFIDPTRPVRSQLVGKLWLHIPHGGALLRWLHTPQNAAVISAIFGLLALLGAGETKRRRRRRTDTPTTPMTPAKNPLADPAGVTAVYGACGVVALVCLLVGAIAFSRPRIAPSVTRVPYTQQISFGYGAAAPAGPVYPTGVVRTGDPIFLSIVHRLRFTVAYRLSTAAPHDLQGSARVLLTLTGPTGWTRNLPLGPTEYFRGPAFRTQAVVDLSAVQSLIARVAQLTGQTTGAGYSIAVAPQVHIRGVLGARALDTRFAPLLSFAFTSSQLQLAGSTGPTGAGAAQQGMNPRQAGSVAATAIAPNSVVVLGHHLSVLALRLAAGLGLLLALAVAVLVAVAKRLTPFDESARIRAQYGHLIVPVVIGREGLGAPVVDVPTIADLARLAEFGQRMILHSRDHSVDTYLLKDEGTVYRYRANPGNVVWGEWSETAPRPLSAVAEPEAQPTVAPSPAAATAAVGAPSLSARPRPEAAPAVWPRPAFLNHANVEASTEVREPDRAAPSVPAASSASAAPSAPAAPSPPRPIPLAPPRPIAARPRLRRWLQSQSERAQAVRDLGSALLGTDHQ